MRAQNLDSSAHLFASTKRLRNSSTFRIAAVLVDEVDPVVLQEALDRTTPRYPMLMLRMRRGLFWNYLDDAEGPLMVGKETDYPTKLIIPEENNGYLIKVLYHGHRISIEVFHALTDGTGALEFLKTLLYHYICIRYGSITSEDRILLPDTLSEEESEDALRRYFLDPEKEKEKDDGKERYHIQGTPFSPPGNSVTSLILSVSELKALSKAEGVTITGYLAAVMLKSIMDAEKSKKRRSRMITVQIPVNLRKIFPSRTLRNFFGVMNITSPFEDNPDMEKLFTQVKEQMKEGLDRNRLERAERHTVGYSTNFISRITPLKFKSFFVSLGFRMWGEKKKTLTISNIGPVILPEGMRNRIILFEELLYPTLKSPINTGVVSFGDRLVFSFSRNIEEKDLIRAFTRNLSQKCSVTVYGNKYGETNA